MFNAECKVGDLSTQSDLQCSVVLKISTYKSIDKY